MDEKRRKEESITYISKILQIAAGTWTRREDRRRREKKGWDEKR